MSWEDDILKAQESQRNFIQKSLDSDFEKARSGVYADTPYNRRKGLVGQHFGSSKKEETPQKKTIKEENSTPESIHKSIISQLEKSKKTRDIKEVFENPNKYGDVVGHITFITNYKSQYEYSYAHIVVNYTNKEMHTKNKYFSYKEMNAKSIMKDIKDNYDI